MNVMRWSEINYPEPMRKLHEDVRKRAVEIANELVEQGMDEAIAINTAIDRAEAWAHHRNDPAEINEGHRNYHHRKENG
jgi:uncharacterized protein YdaT